MHWISSTRILKCKIYHLYFQAVGALACMFFMTEEYPMDIRSYQRATPQKPKTEEHTMVTRIAGTKGRKGSKEKRKIKSPILTYNKWEPPPPPSEISTSRTRESPLSTPRLLPIERSPVHQQGIESEVREIRRALRSFYGRLLEKDRAAKMCREWRVVARVLDRMFFFIYLVVIVVSLGTIFPKSWYCFRLYCSYFGILAAPNSGEPFAPEECPVLPYWLVWRDSLVLGSRYFALIIPQNVLEGRRIVRPIGPDLWCLCEYQFRSVFHGFKVWVSL